MKRLLDIIVSIVALIVLTPLAITLALIIRLDDPGPVFFRQRRIGQHGRHFTMLKFRTMRVDTPNVSTEIMKAMGQSYVTRVGSFLRKTSLDELPQLWNILLGDMSFVGPRPALYNQADLIALREAAGVHSVRPGITGLAQIIGRDDLDISTKVAYDREYVSKRSFWLDLWILWRTVAAVVSARGNY
jgi:O-antigen biosynthesis protein WbqP